MRAMVFERFGGPEVLHEAEVPEPIVGPDSVLVRIDAAGVNPVDFKIREGRLASRIEHVFPVVPGWDLAGMVEQVGPAVTDLSPGDRVVAYGRMDFICHGTYAERVALPRRTLALAPRSVPVEVAAALPLAGLTAYQLIVDALEVREGETVLIHAGAGGVGHLAVQLARWRGARVLATAGEANQEFLESIGAIPLRYGEGLAERVRALSPGGVDGIVDLIGGDALAISPVLLAAGGRLASVTDPQSVAAFGGRYVFVHPDPAQLARLVGLVDGGELRVELASVLDLSEAAEAHRRLQAGHGRGKIALKIA